MLGQIFMPIPLSSPAADIIQDLVLKKANKAKALK